MIKLIIYICTTATLQECEKRYLGVYETVMQCEAQARVYEQVLGRGADRNYVLECAK